MRDEEWLDVVGALWEAGKVIPYLGPGLWSSKEGPGGVPFPSTTRELALRLAEKVTVPGKLRGRLWESAQYIESFRHRKTLVHLMKEIFTPTASPLPIHEALMSGGKAPLIVDTWYDSTLSRLLPSDGSVQFTGTSRSDFPNQWYRIDRKTGQGWETGAGIGGRRPAFLYKPFGSHVPGEDFVVSDADFVEILTEIDIQTPIPEEVRDLRTGRHFLFMGCRFDDQTSRIFARQIMKRSSELHFMVAGRELTKKERRFVEELKIRVFPADSLGRLTEIFSGVAEVFE